MKNSTFLSAKEKEECIVRYKGGESIHKLSKEYNVTARCIWRWPLIKIVHSNPDITKQASAEKLGTSRNPAA